MRLVASALRREWPGEGGRPFVAVDDVSFSVDEGEVFGLLGPNGAGKSTTLRMVTGLIPPTSGTAAVCGVDVGEDPDRVRAQLGYLSATSGLPERLTCDEVLRLFANLQSCPDVAGAVERAVQRHGIAEFRSRTVDKLSTGMRQRVRIACAAVHDPPVLILDEPTAGLDVVAAASLLDDIEAARDRGAAVIFSTHVLREAERVCDRVGILYEGKLRAVDTVAGLMVQTGTDSLDDAFVAVVRQ